MAFFFERDVCAVLEDLKACYETRNFSMFPGLLAELNVMKDRRENLENMEDSYSRLMEKLPKLKEECDMARRERDNLREEIERLKGGK